MLFCITLWLFWNSLLCTCGTWNSMHALFVFECIKWMLISMICCIDPCLALLKNAGWLLQLFSMDSLAEHLVSIIWILLVHCSCIKPGNGSILNSSGQSLLLHKFVVWRNVWAVEWCCRQGEMLGMVPSWRLVHGKTYVHFFFQIKGCVTGVAGYTAWVVLQLTGVNWPCPIVAGNVCVCLFELWLMFGSWYA